ncbi:bifunctional 4-hydroxy-2-oxoglutarate aldolase/2-dehydro-3-deoxy-phosphogluconate aldolase [Streptomyces sp. NPDC047917]|uniref:bifunctional 4-hydroxy-2-oxoglutarate aldolase/2-dehydro-3-deoxy-phosphogluconate aldolase n=1 Tax=Streptomyces sp. NPDC047917 TaxID=3365491 RepID=UPI003718B318
MSTLPSALDAVPVVAILRSATAGRFPQVADTLRRAGVRAVEFTLTTPGVLDVLREYAQSLPDTASHWARAPSPRRARPKQRWQPAEYLITPATQPAVIAEARRLGVPVLPGALTPTEVLTAWQAGASMVKLFPASLGGPKCLRAVRAPLPDVPLVPTGGIELEDAPAYLRASATALGMGGPLVGDACEGGDLGALTERAARLVGLVAGVPR